MSYRDNIIHEWEDGRFGGSRARLLIDSTTENLVIEQLGRDNHWYYIHEIEGYSPFVDFVFDLLKIKTGEDIHELVEKIVRD